MRSVKSITLGLLLTGISVIGSISEKCVADVATSQPTTLPASDATPDTKAIRAELLEWDRAFPKISLQDLRKSFYTQNEREAVYFDWVAHENWEEGKTEQVIRDKWGNQIESQFAHLLQGTTQEDDQVCDIKVDGDHALVSWNIKEVTPLPMIKIDGHWLADGHAMFEKNLKDDPNLESGKRSSVKIMKQAVTDITSDKFDDGDSFIKDFANKMQLPQEGN